MNGMNFLTSSSWECGFVANQAKGLYDQKAPPKEMAKRNSKKQSSRVIKVSTPPQWSFPTSTAALASAN